MPDKLTPGATTQNGLVAESDFTYEAPDNSPDFDLRSAEKNFIDSLLKGEEPAIEPAPGVEDVPEVDEALYEEPDQEMDSEIGLKAEDEDEIEPDPKQARGIQRLVQRELAAKERESAAEAKIREADAKIAELRKYEALKPAAELAELIDLDPLGAFKAMGKDPETVIKLALAQQLGDSAPESLKEFARGASDRREVAKIRAELAQERQARAAQEYFNTISAGAREYVTKLGDVKVAKTLPSLSKAAKVDQQAVHEEIMEEILKEARVKAATDPNGEPLTYEEAAKRVEARFARVAKLLSVQSMSPATKMVQKPNGIPPSTKPAAKPLPPWQRKSSNIEEDGIREALAEFERVEAERKAMRR